MLIWFRREILISGTEYGGNANGGMVGAGPICAQGTSGIW